MPMSEFEPAVLEGILVQESYTESTQLDRFHSRRLTCPARHQIDQHATLHHNVVLIDSNYQRAC